MDVAVKRKVGRPSKYRPELCDDLIKFFSRPLYIKEKKRKWINGEEIVTEEKVANETPFLINWVVKHGIDASTPSDWASKYPEFSKALNKAKQLQEFFLAELGIKGHHNGFMTYQTLKNVSGWRDNKEVEIKDAGEYFKQIADAISRADTMPA